MTWLALVTDDGFAVDGAAAAGFAAGEAIGDAAGEAAGEAAGLAAGDAAGEAIGDAAGEAAAAGDAAGDAAAAGFGASVGLAGAAVGAAGGEAQAASSAALVPVASKSQRRRDRRGVRREMIGAASVRGVTDPSSDSVRTSSGTGKRRFENKNSSARARDGSRIRASDVGSGR
jgi:hypothetical protein